MLRNNELKVTVRVYSLWSQSRSVKEIWEGTMGRICWKGGFKLGVGLGLKEWAELWMVRVVSRYKEVPELCI